MSEHMRSRFGRRGFWILGVAIALAAPIAPFDSRLLADEGDVTLSVAGRTSATPSVASHGNVVAVAWGARTPAGATDVYVAVSRDAGATFGPPTQVNTRPGEARLGGEMPPRVAVTRGPAGAPEVVVLWTARAEGRTEIHVARSVDAGRSFGPPAILQKTDAAGDRGWPALALDETGAAHAVWLDHRGLAELAGAHQHAGHDTAASAPEARDGVATAQKSGLYYAGGGVPGGERALVKGVCYCCKTAIATGAPQSIFMAWRHVYPGNIRDIAFLRSRDGGRTFEPPVRISQDGWQLDGCPDDGPAMVVDQTNTVHIVWPTVVGGPSPQGGIFYASTTDGRTFTARQRVPTLGGPKPSHPQIAIGGSGRLVVAWDEARDGVRAAVVRSLKVAPDGKAVFGPTQVLGGAVQGVYPALAPTPTGLVAVWTSGAPDRSTIAVRRLGAIDSPTSER